MVVSYVTRSWLLLIPLVPSMIVSIFNLYHLLAKRTLRSALNNHVIILLLACGLIEQSTDIIWLIHLYRTGTVVSSTPEFCYAWTFISAVGLASIYFLMAWASIERHILIFHPSWFGTARKRVLFHYLPLGVCIVWPMVFYGVVYLVLPCSVPVVHNQPECGLTWCIFLYPRIALFDSVVHAIVPSFTVIAFSTALFIRVLYHRHRVRKRIEWRKYRKTAAQLVPISILYIFLSFPPTVLYTAYAAGLSSSMGADYFVDSLFFFYWIILFMPFATVVSLPRLQVKCRKLLLFSRRRNTVRPAILAMTHLRANHEAVELPQIPCYVIHAEHYRDVIEQN